MDTSSNYMENRDVEYETSNTIYDECYERNGIKCKNYKLCQHILPPDHYEMLANYLCMSCGDWFKIGQIS
jgi:hypothetical protein